MSTRWSGGHQLNICKCDSPSRLACQKSQHTHLLLLVLMVQDAPITVAEIALWTRRNNEQIQYGWPGHCDEDDLKPRRLELSLQDGCMIWGERVVVPPQGQEIVLAEFHCASPKWSLWLIRFSLVAGHRQSIRERSAKAFELPDEPTTVGQAHHHEIGQRGPGHSFTLDQWLEIVFGGDWCTLQMDGSVSNEHCYSHHYYPVTEAIDNGPQFSASEFQEFCRSNGIWHTWVAPYQPSSNGLISQESCKDFKEGFEKQTHGMLMDKIARMLFQHHWCSPSSFAYGKEHALIIERE